MLPTSLISTHAHSSCTHTSDCLRAWDTHLTPGLGPRAWGLFILPSSLPIPNKNLSLHLSYPGKYHPNKFQGVVFNWSRVDLLYGVNFRSTTLTLTLMSLSRVRLCDPMGCSLPGSSIHGIFQARVLEWVSISFSRRSSPPRDRTQVSYIVGRRFTVWATREVT